MPSTPHCTAICTADLDQLKNSYSKSVRDLFEGRPEGYYPGQCHSCTGGHICGLRLSGCWAVHI